jgi:hypothetical protein
LKSDISSSKHDNLAADELKLVCFNALKEAMKQGK